jgi:N-methylhydantoinase A
MAAGRAALGIDIGGTFTDLVLLDTESGAQSSLKVLTTHAAPHEGVMAGLARLLAETRLEPARIGRVVHATTLFTNALIERKGAVTGLLTTAGFRDVLEIGRERKFELYDLTIRKPEPLVPRHRRLEVAERVRVDGGIETPLAREDVAHAVDRLAAAGCTSLAIAFLHAYANPAHEQQAAEIARARQPQLALSLSSEIAPEIREYERVSTTVANAYVKPLAERYLAALSEELRRIGIGAPLLLMLSNGGLTHVAEAERAPVRLLESGPAAGALAAAHLGRQDGGDRLLAFDMGGTTAKLSVVDDGRPHIAYAFEAARQKRFVEGSGLPIRISTIELIEIGAGGGSIARLDAIGLLKVGPESAGSEPGPAAYGRGGRAPTVTDADLLLGHLDPTWFAGGTMAIDMVAVEAAMAPLVAATGLSADRLAWGIHDVVDESMASAARVHIAERGKDPRAYTLLATGGGGPLHAYWVARKLGIRRIVSPRSAGVASALGLLVAPARIDRVATVARDLDDLDWDAFEATFARLEQEARGVVQAALGDGAATAIGIERIADIRYVGQAFELVVPLPEGPYTATSRPALTRAFEAAYVAAFTRTPPSPRIEVINVRVSVSAALPGDGRQGGPARATGGGASVRAAREGWRSAYFPEAGGRLETPVYDRDTLAVGTTLDGPAIVEEASSTLVVGPGGRLTVAASGCIVVEVGGV